MNIRPVSDLRNNFKDIESQIYANDEPIFLTKNGHGSMVLMSIEQYSQLTSHLHQELKYADQIAEASDQRYTLDEVVERVTRRISEQG